MRDHTTLKAWQTAHASVLFFQLQKASLSVQLNISEGYTFGDSPTFTRHLGIAYGSAIETGEVLGLLVESGIIDKSLMETVQVHNRMCQRLILGLLKRRRTARS